MRITWKRAALGLGGLLALGAAVVVSGVVPIRASSGHWPWTRWFLDFAMSRSVATHSVGIDVPDLDDPALVLRGAGHYELGCTPCHGRPGRGRSEVLLEMTPQPPLLRETLRLWDPAELFYIVRHGVKFTAMPAWPVSGRDDEVWAMVAFLLELPELDEQGYLRLAMGDVAGPGEDGSGDLLLPAGAAPASGICARCHGPEGRGRGLGAFPSLAGQSRAYLASTLRAFARGERRSGTMHAVAAPLDTTTIADLAEYFESRGGGADVLPTREGAARPVDRAARDRGAALARRGLPERKIPACTACHGPVGHERSPHYPILAGQYPRYLYEQLVLFGEERRGGTGFAHLMHAAVREMTTEQMQDLAAYYGSLGSP